MLWNKIIKMIETKMFWNKIYDKEGNFVKELDNSYREVSKNFLKSRTKVKLNQPSHFKDVECEIVGIAERPKLGDNTGLLYIVKVCDTEAKIYDKKTYPYDCFCAYECMFDVIEEENKND